MHDATTAVARFRPYSPMRALPALALFMARRAFATPQLLAIRFVGVLVAVTLVAGVSLYSSAMGDAMLRQRLETDPTNLNIAVSLTGQTLTSDRYAALDRYVRHAASVEPALPLHALFIHHNTSTVGVLRQADHGAQPERGQLPALALDYYGGLSGQVKVVAGTIDAPARMPDGDAPIVVSANTAGSLHLEIGDRLTFSVAGGAPIGPPMVVTGIFAPTNLNSIFWGLNAGDAAYHSLVTPRLDTFQAYAARTSVFVYSVSGMVGWLCRKRT